MRSPLGRLGVIDPHAVAVHAPAAGAHEQRAGRPDEPDAEAPALEHEAGRGVQLARLVPDQVAEQADRHRSARAAAAERFGRTTFAPRWA